MTNRVDLYSGLGFTALSVLVWLGADAMPKAAAGMGAGGYPKFLAVCIGIFGLLLAVRAYLRLRKNPAQKDQKRLNARELLFAGLLGVSFLAYTQLVKPLGYILATFLFFNVFMFIYGERKWWRMLLVSVLFSVSVYFLFEKVFYIMLPNGILGI